MNGVLSTAALLLALGSGLSTGVLFAFSSFVMRALGEVTQGAEAMQRINVVILRSSFMPLFMGLALASLAVIVLAVMRGQTPASPWLLPGGLLYLVGVFGVTAFFNVPLNNELLAATPQTLGGVWANYLQSWTLWNHVRTVAGVGSSLAFIVAFRLS